MAISISIKSELDSRMVLYPMMRCLRPFGSCLICTMNRQVIRLIDNEYEGDFRNFHIIFDPEGATDVMLENANVSPEEYTYVIYDNVAVVEQDKLIIPIGPHISDIFKEEMLLLGEDERTHIIKFGKHTKSSLSSKPSKSDKENTTKGLTEEEIEELAKKKFQASKRDVAAEVSKIASLPFMSFDEVESFESTKTFGTIDRNFMKIFFAIFGKYIGIKQNYFEREVTKKDENRGNI